MTLLVMGVEETQKLEALKKYAEEHPMSMDMLMDIYNGEEKAAGLIEGYTKEISDGFKVVYSIEQQLPGDIRHLSVSCKKSVPPFEPVKLIMEKLGFSSTLDNLNGVSYLEPLNDGRRAINIMELIEGSPVRR